MNARELKILERAFEAEVQGAIHNGPDLLQTSSKLAVKLCDEGFLQTAKIVLGGRFPVTIEGYRLTHAGRCLYCASCPEPTP